MKTSIKVYIILICSIHLLSTSKEMDLVNFFLRRMEDNKASFVNI